LGWRGGLNLYGYGDGDPVNNSDPFGLCPFPPSSCLGREGLDLALSSVPVVSTALDVFTVVTGKNLVTGEDASRAVAFAGLASPAGGGQIRAGARAIGEVAESLVSHALPAAGKGWTKLRGAQGWRDEAGRIWKKDMKHKDHWDVSDKKGNKVMEVDFEGRQIWPDGPKNKNK